MPDGVTLGTLATVSLDVVAELGRCSIRLSDVMLLGAGSVVTLDRDAGAPLDVRVNGELIARGELIAVDERFGVRITEIFTRAPSAAT